MLGTFRLNKAYNETKHAHQDCIYREKTIEQTKKKLETKNANGKMFMEGVQMALFLWAAELESTLAGIQRESERGKKTCHH